MHFPNIFSSYGSECLWNSKHFLRNKIIDIDNYSIKSHFLSFCKSRFAFSKYFKYRSIDFLLGTETFVSWTFFLMCLSHDTWDQTEITNKVSLHEKWQRVHLLMSRRMLFSPGKKWHMEQNKGFCKTQNIPLTYFLSVFRF
jgi:hypothetical protein